MIEERGMVVAPALAQEFQDSRLQAERPRPGVKTYSYLNEDMLRVKTVIEFGLRIIEVVCRSDTGRGGMTQRKRVGMCQ